ncbi:transketolase [uncultured Acetobacteroides sp.]|uniref:transketolase n=1 Tax=uncultured Acetobacteroides sp. TaxID=1760811 RepID=UPI0029F51750|nr:transketolase [uncultured Acetobacteroides sp.]
MAEIAELKQMASQVRRDLIRMISGANSGHPGGSLGCADFMTALYKNVLKNNPEKFSYNGDGQDMFYLSNGHLSALWYSVLARSGYFGIEELGTFRMLGSRLQGHPTPDKGIPGVRVASGSLGQGLSIAIGSALAKKMNGDKSIVFTLHGDGELQEGQIWEAAMFAGAKKVDNIIATVDYNGKQIDGPVDQVLSLGDLAAKWRAFGWEVLTMNGNVMEEVAETLEKAKAMTGNGKPIVILMKTEMGFGVDFMMGTHAWHGKAPNAEQTQKALAQLEETLGDY